jgi:hypothetical protein
MTSLQSIRGLSEQFWFYLSIDTQTAETTPIQSKPTTGSSAELTHFTSLFTSKLKSGLPDSDFETRRRQKTRNNQRRKSSTSKLDDVIDLLESSRRISSNIHSMATEGRVKSTSKRLTRKFQTAKRRLVAFTRQNHGAGHTTSVTRRLRLMLMLLSSVHRSLRHGKHVITMHSGRADYNRLVKLAIKLNHVIEKMLEKHSEVEMPKAEIKGADSDERSKARVAASLRASTVVEQVDPIGVLFVDVRGQRVIMTMNVSKGEERSLEILRTPDNDDLLAAKDWEKMNRTFGIRQELSQKVNGDIFNTVSGAIESKAYHCSVRQYLAL